jgi:tRNA nucleotidyltransferase (CCA-adding enzyme)
VRELREVAPGAVPWIAGRLEEAGFETWAVGGAIRDALLELESDDWDLATRAAPTQVQKIFRRTVPIGVEHGTVGVLAGDGVMYEVTTFRKDIETDGRHAVVEFAETIEDDLARRDFTINAVAWHPLRDELLDPFGGVDDLAAGVLRTVGTAEDRFREDYLRILRALRFAGRYGLRVDPGTWSAIRALVDHLVALSPERVREELTKILDADRCPSRALSMYQESGALAVLYPELSALGQARFDAALAAVDNLPRGRPLLRLAALLRPLPPRDAASILTRLRLSNTAVEETARIAAAPPLPPPDGSPAEFRRWLSIVGVSRLNAVARVDLAAFRGQAAEGAVDLVRSWHTARAVRRSSPPLTVQDLAIDGRCLIGLGLRPGPMFGDILEALLDWVIDEPARNRREVLEERALALAAELADPSLSS